MRIILTKYVGKYAPGVVFRVKAVDKPNHRWLCWSAYKQDVSVPFRSGEEYEPLTAHNR